MAESDLHKMLVKRLFEWQQANFLNRDRWISCDSGAYRSDLSAVTIGNSKPDLYVLFPDDNFIIIGEAKTENDIENDHTVKQALDYYEACMKFPGSKLVYAVPFYCVNDIKSHLEYVAKIKSNDHVEIVILENLPG